jgi:alpha-methylacyl-CoA racemase
MNTRPGALPLTGVTVVDFTSLAPGPLASLLLAAAGARAVAAEHPDGDPPRARLLNRGKESTAVGRPLTTPHLRRSMVEALSLSGKGRLKTDGGFR